MAQLIADKRDVDFVVYEQLNGEALTEFEKYSGFNKKTFDMIIGEARRFSIKEILPTFKTGDEEGIYFDSGTVKVPKGFHKPYQRFIENDYIAMADDTEVGGQGLPFTITQAALDYIIGANFAFSAYALTNHGTGKMIEIFGTPEQKDLYLKKLYSGQWGGTMVLTEPDAGSDVGNLKTTARKNPDGTYSITGNKIFITNGDHDLTDNIIHPVLARIEGAPAGSKGISLFLVPKLWVNDDGSTGEPNDVVCTGIEKKMGLHGSPTCSLSFGSKGQCKGVLLGEENKGMRVMFHMMNEARLAVGTIGLGNASSAYLYALDYARSRKQGRDLSEMANHGAPPAAIIDHPDVKRMLLWIKAHVEGMRSLVYFTANCFDKIACIKDEEENDYYTGLVEVLTPVVKSYCTDRGFEACVQAMQIFGGYGYTREYPVEQLLRDSKINSIYEGTNGIQAMDLLGRKMGMKKGAYFMNLLNEINKTITSAKQDVTIRAQAESLEKAVNRLGEAAMHMGMKAMSSEFKTAFSFASPFLEVTGDIIMAWMLLWRATLSAPRLEELVNGSNGKDRQSIINSRKEAAFYDGQLKSSDYFINAIIPVTLGKIDAIITSTSAVSDISDAAFGGK